MVEKTLDWIVLVMYALAAVAGGLGGCAAAAVTGLRRGDLKIAFFLAYAIIGVVVGALTFAASDLLGLAPGDAKSHIGWALGAGVAVPLILAAHNFGAKFAFKLLGGEVQVTFRRDGDERRRGGES